MYPNVQSKIITISPPTPKILHTFPSLLSYAPSTLSSLVLSAIIFVCSFMASFYFHKLSADSVRVCCEAINGNHIQATLSLSLSLYFLGMLLVMKGLVT